MAIDGKSQSSRAQRRARGIRYLGPSTCPATPGLVGNLSARPHAVLSITIPVKNLTKTSTHEHAIGSLARTRSAPETNALPRPFARAMDRQLAQTLRRGHPPPLAAASPPPTPQDSLSTPKQLPRDNCDRRRPQEEDNSRLKKMSSDLAGKAVSPFLKEHIPGLYAPVGKAAIDDVSAVKDPNTRYCYRHRPDSKCRRAADETKMGFIQRASLARHAAQPPANLPPRNSTASPSPTRKPSPTSGRCSRPPPPSTAS